MIIKSFKLLFKQKNLLKKVKFLKPKEWKDQGEDQDQNQNQND